MSKDLNLCQFIGRMGKDPEIKYTPSGMAVANLSLACGDDYKDKNSGEKVEHTEWIRVSAFGKLAEIIGKYVVKGSQIYVSGKMQTRKWQDQSGQDRYSTDIVAKEMQMLGGRSGEAQGAASTKRSPSADAVQQAPQPSNQAPSAHDEFSDDLPF